MLSVTNTFFISSIGIACGESYYKADDKKCKAPCHVDSNCAKSKIGTLSLKTLASAIFFRLKNSKNHELFELETRSKE